MPGAAKGVDGRSWWGKADAIPARGGPGQNPLKRSVDLTAAALAMAVLLVPMALVATGVLLALGRPVLFRQERVGLGGARFEIVKFRSMRPQAAGAAPLPDEARLVPFGRFLRRTRLDELSAQFQLAHARCNARGLKVGHLLKLTGHPRKDWTVGCVAVTNREMREIWSLVADGTPIVIRP